MKDINEQKSIVDFAQQQFSIINDILQKSESQIDKLKLYRQSLISEAVTGKIDVRDWEKTEVLTN